MPCAAVLLGFFCESAAAVDARDTLLLTNPAISRDSHRFRLRWRFVDGQRQRRGREAADDARRRRVQPRIFSDGKLIAFSAEYDGNTDVYVAPTEGGAPKRLTWCAGEDVALAFTPDGAAVLFRSSCAAFNNRHTQLYTVPISGGFPSALPIPHAHKACYAPDGKRLAYTPLAERFEQWKNYRGGHDLSHLAVLLRRSFGRADPATGRTLQRHGSHVA